MHTLGLVLYILATVGTLTSTIFLGLVFVSVARFRRNVPEKMKRVSDAAELPFVSVLKPLYGMEPRLKETLRSFFQQDYPQYEIVFGARAANDPALAVVSELSKEFPSVPVSVVYSGTPEWPN